MEWYLAVLKNYAGFEGRARRKEFWTFVLISLVVSGVIGLVASATGLLVLTSVYSLIILVPSLAVTVRRLHDVGHSAWSLVLAVIPFGILVLLWYLVEDGRPGPNRYGLNPKGA